MCGVWGEEREAGALGEVLLKVGSRNDAMAQRGEGMVRVRGDNRGIVARKITWAFRS